MLRRSEGVGWWDVGKRKGVWVLGLGVMGIPFVFTMDDAVDVSSRMMRYAVDFRVAIPLFSIVD